MLHGESSEEIRETDKQYRAVWHCVCVWTTDHPDRRFRRNTSRGNTDRPQGRLLWRRAENNSGVASWHSGEWERDCRLFTCSLRISFNVHNIASVRQLTERQLPISTLRAQLTIVCKNTTKSNYR